MGNGNVALDCARIFSKTRTEFDGSDIVSHALDALEQSAIRTVTILGRRGPHQIAMTLRRSWANSAILKHAAPVLTPGIFPPVEADEALEPGYRKSVTILRGFAGAEPVPSQAQAYGLRLFRQAAPDRRRRQGRTDHRRANRARRTGGARGTGETYEVPATLMISPIGYADTGDRGRAVRRGRNEFLNEIGRIADRLFAVGWARRGPAERSEPTGQTAMKSPTRSRLKCQREAPAIAPGHGLKRLLACRGVMATDYDDWRKIEQTEAATPARGPAREFVRHEDWLKTPSR